MESHQARLLEGVCRNSRHSGCSRLLPLLTLPANAQHTTCVLPGCC